MTTWESKVRRKRKTYSFVQEVVLVQVSTRSCVCLGGFSLNLKLPSISFSKGNGSLFRFKAQLHVGHGVSSGCPAHKRITPSLGMLPSNLPLMSKALTRLKCLQLSLRNDNDTLSLISGHSRQRSHFGDIGRCVQVLAISDNIWQRCRRSYGCRLIIINSE